MAIFIQINRRAWWWIVILLVLANILAWRRKPMAGWISNLAMSRVEQGDTSGALNYLDLADFVWRDSPEAHLCLARLQRHEGKFREANEHLQRARYLGIQPRLADLEEWLALAQSGQMKLAEPQLSQLLQSSPDQEQEICLAYSLGYMRLRDFASALALLDGWAEAYPKDARPHAWIGQIHLELEAHEDAEIAFRRALELQPSNASAAIGLGNLLVSLKRPAEAEPFFRIALNDQRVGATAAVGLASCLQAQNQPKESAEVLERAINRFPTDHRLLVQKADHLIEQGDYATAKALLKQEIEAGTRRREIRYAYAIALRGLGEDEQAAEHFAYAAKAAEELAKAKQMASRLSDEPENVELRHEIGARHLRYGNIDDGLLWLHAVLELEPGHRSTHQALADYYRSRIPADPQFIALSQRHSLLAGEEASAE